MDSSGLLRKDPYNISDDEDEEFYSIRTRQRAAKQIKRKDISTRKITDNIERVENDLLGETGLGLTAEEFNALPDSERKQLMEAVLQSKEEYDKQKKQMKSEQLDGQTKNSANTMTANSMPEKLKCSIPYDAKNCRLAPSLCKKLGLNILSKVAPEGKMHTETVACKVNQDYFAAESEANVTKLICRDDCSFIGTEKFIISGVKPEAGETCPAKRNEDSDFKRKTSSQDCLFVNKSNPPDSLICGEIVQRGTEGGEIFSSERETSHGCHSLTNVDSRQMPLTDVSETLRKAERTDETYLDCPDSPTSYELVRKYHIQATDTRPLFKQRGLDLQTRSRLVYDYYTYCELRLYKSYSEVNSRMQWGKPVAIKVDKGRASARGRRLREVITETLNGGSPLKSENQALDSSVCSTSNIEGEEVNKRTLVLPECSDFVEQFPGYTAASDVSVVLDNQYTHEELVTRLRRSRQTKIGGGLVDDNDSKISRRKIPGSDDENDPDFTPEKKTKRIRVDNERSQKYVKPKKSNLDVVKNKDTSSRKTKEQMPECSEASKGKRVSSDEHGGEFLTQESRDLTNSSSWHSARKCQTEAMPDTNGANASNAHSSSSSEEFYDARSTASLEMEKQVSVNDTLKNSSPVSHGVLNGHQINVELEPVLSSSSVVGRNSSSKDDTNLQVFPVFERLARPCLRENEGITDIRNIPSTSRNANSMQTEESEECLSGGDSSEGDDCNLDKSTKKRKRSRVQHPAFPKTYQKRKIKNAADQQTITSFAVPSFKIPKVTQMCPMCQKHFPMSSLEEHVQMCLQMDDEKKTDFR